MTLLFVILSDLYRVIPSLSRDPVDIRAKTRKRFFDKLKMTNK